MMEVNEEDDDSQSDLIPLFGEDEQHKSDVLCNDQIMLTVRKNDTTETTLDDFRKEWKSELDSRLKESSTSTTKAKSMHEQQLHDAATKLFLEGVDCERRGDMWEAVQRYMGAVRMVPDIESKVYEDHCSPIPQSDLNWTGSSDRQRSLSRSRFGYQELGDLGTVLQRRIIDKGKCFEPEFTGKPCPIALLPVELLSILIRYVVGSELDVRCLEMLSMTSAQFYILTRDERLWRAVCHRTFDAKPITDTFTSWRQMYVTCPHVYLHGVYIGKTTYVRHGEASFQDQFYKPWHIVVYYRMLKFFADGTAVMITTPESPVQVVGFLKSKTPRIAGVLTGRYQMVEQNCISVQFRRHREKSIQRSRLVHRFLHQFLPYEVVDEKFDMKLKFGDGKKRRAHCVLQVEEYNCTLTYLDGEKSRTSLDTADCQAYPPLFFSRVKSYSVPDGWDEMDAYSAQVLLTMMVSSSGRFFCMEFEIKKFAGTYRSSCKNHLSCHHLSPLPCCEEKCEKNFSMWRCEKYYCTLLCSKGFWHGIPGIKFQTKISNFW